MSQTLPDSAEPDLLIGTAPAESPSGSRMGGRTAIEAVRQVPTPEELARITAEVDATREEQRAKFDRPPEPTPYDIARALADEEIGDARLFAELYRGRRCYDLTAGRWYRWAGHYWVEHGSALADVEAVVDLYKREADAAHLRGVKNATLGDKDSPDEKFRKALLGRIRALSKRQRQENVLKLACGGEAGYGTSFDRLGISGTEWDQKPNLLACENGVIELLREPPYWRRRDGRPEDCIKAVVPTQWLGIDTPAPRWEQFLAEIFEDHPELPAFMLRIIGYALSGNPVERIFVILWGTGANGKTTFINVLQGVLGQKIAGQIECELFLKNRGIRTSSGPRPDILDLRGMRIAVASETSEGRHIDGAELKRLTGGDILTGRGVHAKDIVKFRPTHTLFQLTNHRPGADAADPASWDRILLVPFTRRFVKHGDGGGENTRPINENLREELLKEGPGILASLVRGWRDFAERAAAHPGGGLAPPEVVRQTTRDYRAEQDVEGRFLRECCEEGPDRTQAGIITDAFKKWCEEAGVHGRVKRLRELILEHHTKSASGGRTFYHGLRLRDSGNGR